MSKNIKDYIHYYIGQPCQTIAPDGIPHSILETINHYWLERSERDGTQLKPILRKLEDMTEEEMKEIYKIIFKRHFGPTGRIQFIDKETTSACKRWCLMHGLDRVGIEHNGTIWADCDLQHYKHNPHFVNHYLLSKGFDLFGLIDAALAIDAKTIPHHQ